MPKGMHGTLCTLPDYEAVRPYPLGLDSWLFIEKTDPPASAHGSKVLLTNVSTYILD